jgi:GH25 family lysozyme M1 (1,4-beta-N-acetylmuramidase)
LDEPDPALGEAGTALLAASGVRVAQADPAASPAPTEEALTIPPIEDPSDQRPRRGARARVRGIDVSHHNGDIDYADVLDAGRSFVFVKATQDTSFRDPMFEINVQRARQAGVLTGAYHFFDYTLDGAEQADHFIDHIERAGGPVGWLPPVIDVECWRASGISTHVTSAARLRDFVDRIYERTGQLPIIYTSVFMWDQVMGESGGFGDLPLWAACWGCANPPSLANGWDDWHFWQTGVARIRRVGRLDGNQFNGTASDLAAMVLRPFRIAGGAVSTDSTTVELDLGGRDADEIRTSPDGVVWTDWRPLRGVATAELQPVAGPQKLYVQLQARGAESPVVHDAITLDLASAAVTDPPVPMATVIPELPGPSASAGTAAAG